MDNISNNFPENELYGLNKDGVFKWKGYDTGFLPFKTIIEKISESRLINILKEFTEASGQLTIDFMVDRSTLELKIDWPNFKECIFIESIPIDFYNKLIKTVSIDTDHLYNEVRQSKKAVETYKKFSDEEKLKIELDI